MKVDDQTTEYPGTTGRPAESLDLDGYLYLGGVPRIMYNNLPEEVRIPSPWHPGGSSESLDMDGYIYVGGVPRIMYNNLPEHVRFPSPRHSRMPRREPGPGRVPLCGRSPPDHVQQSPRTGKVPFTPAHLVTPPRTWTWTGTSTWEESLISLQQSP